jgi:L-iditol 2-dehydrogenase/threonine 3-dehydrogenase
MKQAIMRRPGVIEFQNMPDLSALNPGEVLLAIQRIGICGSDIHVYHGKHPFTPYPVIQGHEYSGIVRKIGAGVTKVKVGAKATARPQLVCGKCGPCLRGDYNVCQHLKVQGFQAPGCAQDYFIVDEERLVPFPEHMSFDEGAFIEPASVGAHATGRASALRGKNVVVAGAGTIGNLIAQFARVRGAAKVLITDLSDFRLAIAKRCGIEYTANTGEESLADAVKRVFGDEGFQTGFEAVGVQPTIDGLVDNIEKGGEIIVAGVFEKPPAVNMAFVGEHELKLIGTMMYKHEDYQEAVGRLSAKEILVEPLITNHFPFDEFLNAYRFIDEQKDKTLKVIITVQ